MKRSIYIFLLAFIIISCSESDEDVYTNTVKGTIILEGSVPIEFVTYTQQDKEIHEKVNIINIPTNGKTCEFSDVFNKGFTTYINTSLASYGKLRFIVKSNNKVIKDETYNVGNEYGKTISVEF